MVLAPCLLTFLLGGTQVVAEEMETNGYVGSVACQPCHEQQFRAFHNFARKSHSFASVEKMAVNLPEEKIRPCYGCHTTGYGKPSGFVSPEQTPELKNVGCEACHGPGRLHVKTQDPALIRRTVTIEVCKECHTEERVQAFRYKPILYAGSH
ncbi:MAG: cytochrome C [Deltaproteobacteria bacterium RIFOXYD12_FULL_57_12]|nr:MAG: cytochrome C [Deltaproteobacteria bacterium RIFOXYD12_FULL_57_12]